MSVPFPNTRSAVAAALDKQQTAAPPLTMVIAATPSGVIGHDGSMPWQLSTDLARFKKITIGGTLIMGRKTFDSIGRPLPGRETIVITRQADWQHAGVHHVGSAEEALERLAQLGRPGYVVGGAEVFRLMFPQIEQIWWTCVWSATDGDTRVEVSLEDFQLVEVARLPQTARDSAPTELQKWVRKKTMPKTWRPH